MRPLTIALTVLLVVAIVLIGVPVLMGPRAEQVRRQNEMASSYVAAVKQQIAANPAFSDFWMELIRQGLDGGAISFHCTLASTNDEIEFRRILSSRSSPYKVGGSLTRILHKSLCNIRPQGRRLSVG